MAQARTAVDHAEGFGLGLETVKALNAATYLAVENATMARLLELQQ